MSKERLESVTGVQLMQGIGHAPAQGFWADAWGTVLKRKDAVVGLCWILVVGFFAIFSPLVASGHPLMLRQLDEAGNITATTFPLFSYLAPIDLLLPAGLGLALPIAWFVGARARRAARVKATIAAVFIALAIVIISGLLQASMGSRSPLPGLAWAKASLSPGWLLAMGVAVIVGLIAAALPLAEKPGRRARIVLSGVLLGSMCTIAAWDRPSIEKFDYTRREQAKEISATFTVVPFSPSQRFSELSRLAPGTTLGEGLKLDAAAPGAGRTFHLGTDAFGSDVLSQMMHACRLSISIGLVSTSIALVIGVTLGALMGYFGGIVDLVLYRIVEIFMAVPVLFLLIVAAAVLPPELRTTYMMMAIIGAFSWTGMARFTRAEFMKLRNQDFVQAAKAAGLPLRSVLFKHMLPNGVAPVLVDTSFAIASAITIEAVLSYLNLGPIDQASWGKLLASAVSSEGEFKWWLAVFPGVAIFFTVLSYNIIGEALRDAIDPKLKKARV